MHKITAAIGTKYLLRVPVSPFGLRRRAAARRAPGVFGELGETEELEEGGQAERKAEDEEGGGGYFDEALRRTIAHLRLWKVTYGRKV